MTEHQRGAYGTVACHKRPTPQQRCESGKCILRGRWIVFSDGGAVRERACDLHLPDTCRRLHPLSDGTLLVEVMGRDGQSALDQPKAANDDYPAQGCAGNDRGDL